MKLKYYQFTPALFLFVVLFTLSSCNNENEKVKSKTVTQENVAKGSMSPVQNTNMPDTVVQTTATTSEDKSSIAIETPAVVEKTTTPGQPKPVNQPVKNELAETKVGTQPAQTNTPTVPSETVEKKENVVASPDPVKEVVVTKPAEPDKTNVVTTTQEKWVVPAKDKAKVNPLKGDAESISTGKVLYQKHCASCHGKTGAGDGTKAAQLDKPLESFRTTAFQSQTDGSLFYKIRVGKDDMPSYRKKIPDEDEVWAVVNYLRTLK